MVSFFVLLERIVMDFVFASLAIVFSRHRFQSNQVPGGGPGGPGGGPGSHGGGSGGPGGCFGGPGSGSGGPGPEHFPKFHGFVQEIPRRCSWKLLGIKVPELYSKLREPQSFHVSKDGLERLVAFRFMTKKLNCLTSAFPMLTPLELEIRHFGREIRILHEISSLEPAPQVWSPKSRSENEEIYRSMCFFLTYSWG